MFQGGSSPSIYITCTVKATLASAPSDALHKSCSFSNGWLAADGNHQVCACCDSTCGPEGDVMLLLGVFIGKARPHSVL
ncbi:POM121 and ZP3 fusion protein-like [Carassius auratus]|uniref:POM121 and ZP3 fusion protein-like n=1 Tax=Carassius auratus TaxID=7957 RepID=A0A6P6NCW1_CARAU|nr:POM121 and ZP3 fusion protein-like [Carassius auratus]